MDQENVYVITLLPEDDTLERLNNIKNYFYANDFKFKRKISTSNSHVTISELNEPKSWDLFEEELEAIVSHFNKIKARVCSVTDEIKFTEKYPEGEGWVALLFDNEKIKNLYFKVDEYLRKNYISLNKEYINSITKLSSRKLDTLDCIANHLNLCNHCRPEKVAKAKKYILRNAPTEILFDKLVVREKSSVEQIATFNLH